MFMNDFASSYRFHRLTSGLILDSMATDISRDDKKIIWAKYLEAVKKHVPLKPEWLEKAAFWLAAEVMPWLMPFGDYPPLSVIKTAGVKRMFFPRAGRRWRR